MLPIRRESNIYFDASAVSGLSALEAVGLGPIVIKDRISERDSR